MNFKITKIVAVIAFLITTALLAQESVTFDRFLNNLIETHPIFERTEYGPRIIEAEREGLTGSEDWNINSSAGVSSIAQTASTGMGIDRTTSAALGGGVSRTFWSTGGIMSAEISLGNKWLSYNDNPIYAASPNNAFENSIYVSYIQPLMKNWQGLLYTLPYDMKSVEAAQESLSILEVEENFLAMNTPYFLDWVYFLEEKKILEHRRDLARQSLEQTKKKRARNIVDEVDVIRAENSLKNVEMAIESNEMSFTSLIDRLVEITGDGQIGGKSPRFDIFEAHELRDIEEIATEFVDRSRVLSKIKKTIELLDFKRKISEESMKSDLSLQARVGVKDYDEDFLDAIAMDKPDVSLNLIYEFPLDKTASKADLRSIELQVGQIRLQIAEAEIKYLSGIRALYAQVRDMQGIMAINREQIELAERQTIEEVKQYEVGRNDFTNVIRSQDSEANARLTLMRNALTYHKLYIQLLSLIDGLYSG
ncbi:TolC family protein [bacterium]|nr:TolC family protein [bacterium]